MDFNLSKTEELFLQMIREFAEKEVKPLAAEIDEQERFPIETVEKMGKIGLMGIPIPKQYGGALISGVNGAVVKGHGSSDAFALYNAIRQLYTFVETDVLSKIKEELK